ncbi:uncharacterized protein PG998_013512 [Apiospora kogelbergensis]|uniref:uncharacterized protein n=1 Tax=Apiospora kogelbergensis TaxID=1337665 RepID=UPI00312EC58C
MRSLEEQITTQGENLEEYKDQIHAQSQLIDCTTAEKDKLAAQVEQERERAELSLSKVGKLHTKCQEFKTQLNAATEEHQRLYRRNREMILTAQKEQEARSEQVRQENEKIRADIQSSVIEVSREAQEQIAKLNEETSTLRIQLDERQKDLFKEKDISEGLRKELDQAQLLLTQNVKTLASQNDRILETLSQNTKHAPDADLISEQAHRLDTVLKSIEDVRVSNQGTITDLVQSLKNDLVSEVSGAIREEMTSKQSIRTEDQELLTTGIGSIQDVCDHIYNEVRDDKNSQRVQYMYQESQHKLQLLDERLQETLEQWQQAESWNFEFGRANEELRAELAALEKENKELQADAEAAQALNEENCSLIEHMEYQKKQLDTNSDLEEHVVSLEATISNLQTEVEVHRHLEDEVARLEDRIIEKDQTVKRSGEASKQLEEKLEKVVRQSKGLEHRLQEDRQELHRRLESSEKERSRLGKDLENARKRIQELSLVRSVEEAEMKSLREKMDEQDVLTKEVGREVQAQRQMHERTMALFTEFSKDNKEMECTKRELLEESEKMRRINPATTPADLTDERTRRVVVQSPKVPDAGKAPLTVEEEREARRQAIPPKSIMRVLRSNSRDLEALTDKDCSPEAPEGSNGLQPMFEKPVVSNHSMYNRPVRGASNDQTTHGSGSQKRARSSSVPNDAGGRCDEEYVNKRAKPLAVAQLNAGPSRSTRPKISQLMSGGLQDSEDEVTEKDMSTRIFGNPRNSSHSQRGGHCLDEPPAS